MLQFKPTAKEKPYRVLVYGRDGTGKSTFASQAPRPAFIAAESGLENINAMAFQPESWEDVLQASEQLISDTNFDTIVVDSLDWIEPLVFDYVCREGDDRGPKPNVESFGFGKGYVIAINQWRKFLSILERARNNGKHVILIAHMVRKPVKNLTGEDYDSFVIKLNEKAAGLIREWVDVVGMAELEVVATKLNPHESVKGSATGRRLLRTAPSAAFDSKTRFSLPDRLELNWGVFHKAIKEASFTQIPKLKNELDIYLKELNDATVAEKCKAFLLARGETVAALNESITTVRKYIELKAK